MTQRGEADSDAIDTRGPQHDMSAGHGQLGCHTQEEAVALPFIRGHQFELGPLSPSLSLTSVYRVLPPLSSHLTFSFFPLPVLPYCNLAALFCHKVGRTLMVKLD